MKSSSPDFSWRLNRRTIAQLAASLPLRSKRQI
jgi:hypothetical protein